MLCLQVQEVLLEGGQRISLLIIGRKGLLQSVKQYTQKNKGRYLVQLISIRNRGLHQCIIPCVMFANKKTLLYLGELSYVFDFTRSLLYNLKNRLQQLLLDKLLAIASVSTFDQLVYSEQNNSKVKSITRISEQLVQATEDTTLVLTEIRKRL